jgi:hypothetical protein
MTHPSRLSPLFLACGLVCALAPLLAAGTLADLAVTEGKAREAVFDSIISGSIAIVGKAEVFKAAPPGTRVLFVKAVTTLARAYVESSEFAARYADHREANQPDPLPPGKTADEILAKQRTDYEKQVEGIRAMFAEITPEQRETLERGFVEMRARFDKMEEDGSKAELVDALQEQHAREVVAHEQMVRDFETLIPKDPNALVALRLRAFLDLTKDIDFSAKLVERNKVMHFADAALEDRPAEWKRCFRAGKEATAAARAFAQTWLSALESRGVK